MAKHFYFPFEKDGRLDKEATDYHQLTEFEKYQLSYHPERPKYKDYLLLFSNVKPCFKSKEFGSCLIQSHRANFKLDGKSVKVMLVGQQSGPTSNYKKLIQMMKNPETVNKWNHGMPTPGSYARAIKAIQAANEENRIIIIFIDTPGADPTESSEAGGIAWKIGKTIQSLVESKVPTIGVIINRACSGGAIALTGCDVVLALEYSTYLVIAPEACSSILFHTRSRANEAAEASKITSEEGFDLGIVDEIILEPEGPAHRHRESVLESLRVGLQKHLRLHLDWDADKLYKTRIARWSKIGHWDIILEKEVKETQKFISRLPLPNKEGFIKRHNNCYRQDGSRVYDPVNFLLLKNTNYTCEICGYRYARPSAWDYINLILDKGSFREHDITRLIADKDILGFPGYAEKLIINREKTGLMTSMITGNGQILGKDVVYCGVGFGFLGGSFCMSTGEKIWRSAEIAIARKLPMVLVASGGGARMHEGCSSMVSIPKAQLAITRVERAGLKVITVITDPTLGGVAIGYGSRGIQLFEINAGNIGFSGKRVIEQFTGKKTSKDFQKTEWLYKHGHVQYMVSPGNIQKEIHQLF